MLSIGCKMVPREYSQVSLQFPARGGVSPLHPVRSTAKNLNPATTLREYESARTTVPESPHCTVLIGGRIGIRKGQLNRSGSDS